MSKKGGSKIRWLSTGIPGIRFREHSSRKNGIKKDRYFCIYYRHADPESGKKRRREEGLGWASEGWTVNKAVIELGKLKEANRVGEGPRTLSEKRELADVKAKEQEAKRHQESKDAKTFDDVFTGSYFPIAKANKTEVSCDREDQLYRLWIKPVIGKLALKQIAPSHLEKIKQKMGNAKKAARSIRYALAVVRQVFNHARGEGLFSGDNPRVEMPAQDNRRVRYLTVPEADALLKALAERSVDLRDMATLALYAGLRFGEIAGLTWGDADFINGLLFIKDTKTDNNRHVPMSAEVRTTLEGRVKGKPGDLIFEGRKGKHTDVSRTFEICVDEVGLNEGITDRRQRATFHGLRHTFASWLVQNGTDLYTVGRLLGHRTPQMTARYAHMSQDTFRGAIDALERKLDEVRKRNVRLVKA